jgi:hypothetical protein
MSHPIIWTLLILPLPLLAVAWAKKRTPLLALVTLSGSAILLVSSAARPVKLALLGPDYSDRLFIAIGLNIVVALAFTAYTAAKGRRIAAIAGMILTLGWFYMWAINSVV